MTDVTEPLPTITKEGDIAEGLEKHQEVKKSSIQSDNLKIISDKQSTDPGKSEKDVQGADTEIKSSLRDSQNVENNKDDITEGLEKHKVVKKSSVLESDNLIISDKKSTDPNIKSEKDVQGADTEIKSSLRDSQNVEKNKDDITEGLEKQKLVENSSVLESDNLIISDNKSTDPNIKSEKDVQGADTEIKSSLRDSQNVENNKDDITEGLEKNEVVKKSSVLKNDNSDNKSTDPGIKSEKDVQGADTEIKSSLRDSQNVENNKDQSNNSSQLVEPVTEPESLNLNSTNNVKGEEHFETQNVEEVEAKNPSGVVKKDSETVQYPPFPEQEIATPDVNPQPVTTNFPGQVHGGFKSNRDVKRPSITPDPILARSGASATPQQQPLMHAVFGLLAFTILMRFFMSSSKFFFVIAYAALVALVVMGHLGQGPFVQRRRR
ncbi:uncharacterized protein MAL13P1.304-like [Macrosteles quadrilineatus]|uniref:uncharacterized protein MAL13P1.304-like n=1 Tax=Macrosteles quadrilineatus TaxID=74068 RepID=UPI0023E2B760|nr:uncharacterized protein MAL13P1.304-like [Macrosteles quadrilineatus]